MKIKTILPGLVLIQVLSARMKDIVDVIPGDAGYKDFWQVNKVTVPLNTDLYWQIKI